MLVTIYVDGQKVVMYREPWCWNENASILKKDNSGKDGK